MGPQLALIFDCFTTFARLDLFLAAERKVIESANFVFIAVPSGASLAPSDVILKSE